MPIYEYECTACRVRFERSQSVHDVPVLICPECGGATRRVFHPVGIIFKGSGFYVTDNRKPSTPAASGGSSKGNGDDAKNAPSSASEKSEKAESKSPVGEKVS